MLKVISWCWIKVHNSEESALKVTYILLDASAQQSWSVLKAGC